MGKVKKGSMASRKAARVNPTGVVEAEEADTVQPTSEMSILQKLASPSLEERHCSCLSLANIVLDEESATRLLEEDLVRKIGPLLVDPDRSVREAAAGALRNLSLCQNEKACEQMIAADVMTPVIALFVQAFGELKEPGASDATAAAAVAVAGSAVEAKDKAFAADRLSSCVEQTLHLLLNLIEASPVAVEVFNREGLLSSVIECVQPSQFSDAVVSAAAQCLGTVSENNPAAANIILSTPALIQHLTSLATSLAPTEANAHLQAMLACTLSNLVPNSSSDVQLSLLPIVFSVTAHALQIDGNTGISRVSASLVGMNEENQEESSDIKLLKSVLSAQQTVLEIMTNLCSIEDGGDDEDEEWEDAGDADADMEDEEVADDPEDATQSVASNGITSSIVVKHLSSALSEHQLLAKVAEKCEGVPSHLVQMLACSEAGRTVLGRCERVQCRALTTLQALSSALPVEAIGTADTLLKLWTMVFNAANQPGVSSGLLEALTGTLRSTAVLLKKTQSCVPVEHVHALCQACMVASNAQDVKINVLATLTVLGGILLAQPGQLDTLTVMAKCFVDSASHATSVRAVSEALDGVFDVFADGGEVGDAAVAASGMLASLRQLAPKLKTQLRQGPRSVGRDYPVLQSAHLNLVRFLKYMAKKSKGAA
ncbi:HEAT repeat-containing protein 3-like [Sycon ciliatum]|uniref:HEAT repeat-containing protein 3-like n=1 Tax=Sycon ciliatum TaxID=27933 RepID=UPI0031F714F4|eukprot:scpid60864/ scgid4683/ HEAT repeat-containing protein 3